MKNFIQNGDSIQVIAPVGGIVGGDPYKVGGIVGVAVHSADEGAACTIRVSGVYEIKKTAALALSAGDKLYWDNAAKEVNKTSAGNTVIGYAWADAAGADAVGIVKLFHG